jgi:hypothetical protein
VDNEKFYRRLSVVAVGKTVAKVLFNTFSSIVNWSLSIVNQKMSLQQRVCSGFSPDSLFITPEQNARVNHCACKDNIYFLTRLTILMFCEFLFFKPD